MSEMPLCKARHARWHLPRGASGGPRADSLTGGSWLPYQGVATSLISSALMLRALVTILGSLGCTPVSNRAE